VKAGFLYNFTRFIEWPANALKAPEAPFVIGILGNDPFGAYLDSILTGEKAWGHPLAVHRFQYIKDIQNCHILFISVSSSDTTSITEIHQLPILTVSDADDFMKRGGMIRLFMQNNKIRVQINVAMVKDAKLNISSKLLRLAEIYIDKK
jgi:hypothetical protein